MTKKELRQRIRTAKSQQDSAALRMWSHEICEKLLDRINTKLPSLLTGGVGGGSYVLAYYPLPDEVDIRPVIDALYNKGTRVLLPRVTGDTTMELRLYEGPESLQKGAFGIMEPTGPIIHHSSFIIHHSSLALVPGMAFDSAGHRLGRGKGYYDRFLSAMISIPREVSAPRETRGLEGSVKTIDGGGALYKIGICYPFQIVGNVPFDKYDMMMDEVISTDTDDALESHMSSLRQEMLKREYINDLFLDYPTNKHKVVDSELYRIIRSLPKGGLLHTHSFSTFDLQYALEQALSLPETRIYLADDGSEEYGRLMFLPQMDADALNNKGWTTVEDAARQIGDVKTFLTDLYTFKRQDDTVWPEFERIFSRVQSIYGYLPVYEPLFKYSCCQMIDEGISFFDYRTLLGDLYRPDGSRLTDSEKVQKIIELTAEVKAEHPDFNMHIIYCGLKSFLPTQLCQSLDNARDLMREFPGVVIGYDLVGEETLVNQLSEKKDILKSADVPFLFHAGEHLSNVNNNIETAVQLGTKRIGHGFNLFQFPETLVDMIRERQIVMEVCPISNQMLGYCHDIRNHPAKDYIRMGLKVSISSDDHALFGTNYLTDDFFIAYLSWGLSLGELRRLMYNSLDS